MPKNKTRQPRRVTTTDRDTTIRHLMPEDIQLAERTGACVCTASTLLQVIRGDYSAKCTDMPWKCPLRQATETPSV